MRSLGQDLGEEANPVGAGPRRPDPNRGADRLVVSTARLPAREQFAFWREGLLGPAFGVHGEPPAAADRGFRGEVEAWVAPCLEYYRYSSEEVVVSRGPRELARRRLDAFCLYREHRPGPGDLVVGDVDAAFTYRAPRDGRLDIWLLPRALVAPHLPAQGRPFAARLRRGDGISPVLSAFAGSLARQMRAIPPARLEAAVDSLARLVAVAFGAPRAEHRGAVRAALVERAKQHVSRHLADPALTPSRAAAALGVSERTLHLAFERSGASFAEWVRRRRLAECRAALASSVAADRSVADIAFAWGFQSLPTFYRAFQRAYGDAPGAVREAAQRGRPIAENETRSCAGREDAAAAARPNAGAALAWPERRHSGSNRTMTAETPSPGRAQRSAR